MDYAKRIFLIGIFLALAVAGIVGFFALQSDAHTEIEDPAEAEEIERAIEKGYEAIGYASRTNDPSKLSEILVDTSDFRPTRKIREQIKKVYGAKAARKAGYLTAMETKYILAGIGEKKMQEILDKARAENREVTRAEWQEIIQANGGTVPPEVYDDPNAKQTFTFEKIEINGDRATVYYDDMAAYQKATLVKIDGKWFISNIEPIVIHF